MAGYKIGKEDQRFFLGTEEIPGVQNLNIRYQIPATTIPFLGNNNTILAPNGPLVGSCELTTIITTDETIVQYTGARGVNGYVFKDLQQNPSENFSFISGYLSSYSCSCSIGDTPRIDANFVIFGDVGKLPVDRIPNIGAIQAATSNRVMKIAGPGGIVLSSPNLYSDRLSSFKLEYNIQRNPIYVNGQIMPQYVEIDWPIEVNFEVTIDKDQYASKYSTNYPRETFQENLNLSVNDFLTNQPIVQYNIPNLTLISEGHGVNVDGNVVSTLAFKGYVNR